MGVDSVNRAVNKRSRNHFSGTAGGCSNRFFRGGGRRSMHRVLSKEEGDGVPAPGHHASVRMHRLCREVVSGPQHLPHVQRASGGARPSVHMKGRIKPL